PRVYSIGGFGSFFDPLKKEPLSRRAWTLQERILSHRILHYGTDQMYWECQEYLLPEDGAYFPTAFPGLNALLLNSDLSYGDGWLAGGSRLTPSSHKYGRWRDRWLKLIEIFSERNLTREYDKLPALSGLARSFAAHTGDTYCAGIWKCDIIMG